MCRVARVAQSHLGLAAEVLTRGGVAIVVSNVDGLNVSVACAFVMRAHLRCIEKRPLIYTTFRNQSAYIYIYICMYVCVKCGCVTYMEVSLI